VQEPVFHDRLAHLDTVGQHERALELTRRDAAMQVDAVVDIVDSVLARDRTAKTNIAYLANLEKFYAARGSAGPSHPRKWRVIDILASRTWLIVELVYAI